MLFIVVHQVYELWFKQILHELDYLRQLLRNRDTPRCLHTLKWDAFLHYLAGHGYPVPPDLLARDVTQPVEAAPAIQQILIDIYRNNPEITEVCERLVDLDEGLQEWRYRHVKMVERTIGTRRGIGGSAGAGYLKTTLFRPVFPDLWAIRTAL